MYKRSLKEYRMKNIVLLIVFCVGVISISAQKHSYLLHTDANVAKLKRQIQNTPAVKSAWEEQLEKANKLLEKDRCGAADCQLLGLAYRMTGDDKYAESIKRILLDYTSRKTWEGRDLLNREPAWTGGLNTSHTGFYISLGYDCIYHYLTSKERKQIAEGLVRVCIEPLKSNWLNPQESFHTFDTMGHNWWSACVYMAGFASLAIQNEVPEAKDWAIEISETIGEWITYSGSVLQNKPRNFDRNGGFYESINYASYGVSQYLLFRLAMNNTLPEIKQPKVDELEKMANFFIHTTYYIEGEAPMVVNFGDGSTSRTGNACVLLLWDLGYQKDAYAWYLEKTMPGNNKEAINLHTPNGLILNPDLPEIADDFTPNMPLSELYKDMGWATMRNSWENDATFVAVKSGLTWNHTHADAGSFIVFHNGKYLIIDSGNSSYGNPLYTQYYSQSEAHNVVLFNGEGQDREDPYYGAVNHGSLHNLVDADDFKYLLANATGPYSHILKRNYRHFVWIGDVLLVIDDVLAREPGQFEWLLHYNGESKRRGLDLSIKDGDAEVLVRPLFPETFPDGGLAHDFPEKMRLKEKQGYEDHHPEKNKPYWSVSHFEKTARTKFITAITFKTEENKDELPVIERIQGQDYQAVRITQNGKTTEIYLNLLADGRIKHRNSVIEMNGWQTDAYLTAITFKAGVESKNVENIEALFISHGSYLRKEKQTLIHALSKFTAYIDGFNTEMDMIFQGQPKVKLHVYAAKPKVYLKVNGRVINGEYQKELKSIQFKVD